MKNTSRSYSLEQVVALCSAFAIGFFVSTMTLSTASNLQGAVIPTANCSDPDGDGVCNTVTGDDMCPSEDASGFDANRDGCIDDTDNTDTDGDGIDDMTDLCPGVYARTADGCPADTDGDGIDDTYNTDTDGDGIDDMMDLCPGVYARTADGCPADTDGDGVTDDMDIGGSSSSFPGM